MRRNPDVVYAYRAAFGVGFVLLGAVTLWRIAIVPVPAANKMLGVLLAAAMIALGTARIVQYVRYRNGPR
jgi:hypothetical protein